MPFQFLQGDMMIGGEGLSGSALPLDPAAAALIARMSVAPNSVRQGHINTLIASLKSAGVWTKLDALYVTAAHDAGAAVLNWKADAFNLTAVNAPTFTADRGYAGNGTSSYLNSGFNPLTAGGGYTLDNAHMGAWVRSGGSGWAVGNSTAGIAFTAAPQLFTFSNSGAAVSAPTGGALGYGLWSRLASTGYAIRQNSNQIATNSNVSVNVSNTAFTVGALAGIANFSTQQVAAFHFGAGLTTAENAAAYAALQVYMQAVGDLPVAGATLDLDFARGVYTGATLANLTTVRASPGMAQRLDGSWVEFAANVPRITDKGLLVEESRINYVRNSMDMLVPNGAAGGWGGTNTTLSRASFPAPDGSMTATVVTSTAVNSDHYIEQWPVTLVPVNAPITISCFVRDISRRYVTINFYDATTTANFVAVTYDLQTLAASAPFAGGAATAISHSITPLGTGWFRLTLTATLSAAATTGIIFRIRNAQGLTTATGHPGNGEEIAVWGAQAEPGTFATSPIRTTGAAVTRAADQVQMPVGAWFNPATMTAYGEFSMHAPFLNAKYPGVVSLNNSTLTSGYSDRINLYLNGNIAEARVSVHTGNVSQADLGFVIPANGAKHKLAGAIAVNDVQVAMDGVGGPSDTSVALPPGINRLEFGVLVQGAHHLGGYIQRVAYYPTRLSNADLQTLTA